MTDENMIKNSPAPIDIEGTKVILKQMMNCICKIKINQLHGTGFFCKIPFKNNSMNVLMTNYHIINDKYYKSSKELNLLLNDDSQVKTINLEIDRETYFNKDYDITIIELKENDNISNFLELDDNLFKKESKVYYNNISIYIPQYFLGVKASVSYGLSTVIDKYEIKHLCSTEHGSSGSPILNLMNKKVIGIHKQGAKDFNVGTLLKFPLEDFLTPKHDIKTKQCIKRKLVKLELLIDIKNQMKPGHKINITFSTTSGQNNCISVNYGTTIDEALKYYLRKINNVEYIGTTNIKFSFNAQMLKFGDTTPVEKKFLPNSNNRIFVVHKIIIPHLYNDWTKEEEKIIFGEDEDKINQEIIKLYSEILTFEPKFELKPDNSEFYKYLDEKKITVIFNKFRRCYRDGEEKKIFLKKELSCKVTLSNQESITNLIETYNLKAGTGGGIFCFGDFLLEKGDQKSLFNYGLDNNSIINVFEECYDFYLTRLEEE